jgi:hypothetical protein
MPSRGAVTAVTCQFKLFGTNHHLNHLNDVYFRSLLQVLKECSIEPLAIATFVDASGRQIGTSPLFPCVA